MNALNELKTYLREIQQGPVLEVSVVETLLVKSWDELVSDDTSGFLDDATGMGRSSSMRASKLGNRTEGLAWNPPYLTFDLERHGGVVMGGKVEEVHSWRVNVEEGTAEIVGTINRRIYARGS